MESSGLVTTTKNFFGPRTFGLLTTVNHFRPLSASQPCAKSYFEPKDGKATCSLRTYGVEATEAELCLALCRPPPSILEHFLCNYAFTSTNAPCVSGNIRCRLLFGVLLFATTRLQTSWSINDLLHKIRGIFMTVRIPCGGEPRSHERNQALFAMPFHDLVDPVLV